MIRVKYTDQRRQSRTAALQSLFAADVRGIWNDPPLEWLDEDEDLPRNSIPFAQELLGDRKSTRLNSSHKPISYAVFCLKKKTLFPFDF